eukprot:jgi/Chrpa1/6525/Chrysochromulina_OHIO_Genome00006885-RA
MDFLPEAHGDRFVVPRAITIEQLEGCKRRAPMQLPKGVLYRDFYPSIVVTYASGRRTNRKDAADDCEGSGPGVMYAMGLMEFFHERGLQCFSGLQVPPGVDWETFMLRLTGENGKREKPKVLIIILTAGLFHSKPCLKEIDTAIKNKIALLPVRFEDRLPAKEEQWTNLDDPVWEMRKFHVQAKLNKLNNIPNPGTVLNRATALEDILAELEKHLPAPASPATSTPTPQPPPPTKPSGGPSGGPRFPVGSRVYVDQGHGQARLGHVATYNAAKGTYTVELGERGSGELDTCFDQDLRNADGPLSQLIDSARERVGSLFGVTPLVIDREGATTENATASKPTPQPPASPTKPAPKPRAQAEPFIQDLDGPPRSPSRAVEQGAEATPEDAKVVEPVLESTDSVPTEVVEPAAGAATEAEPAPAEASAETRNPIFEIGSSFIDAIVQAFTPRGTSVRANTINDADDIDDDIDNAARPTVAIGAPSEEMIRVLSGLDNRLADALRTGDIKLLRVSWLRRLRGLLRQPDWRSLKRRQELEALRAESPFLSAEEAVALLRRGNRGVGALTHGWLSPGECDPDGARLDMVLAALDEHPHIEGVFWDYASLFQNLPDRERTPDERAAFGRAIKVMADVYAS